MSALICMSGLAGCVSNLPPPRDPVKMTLTVTASASVNPNDQKHPAPIVVRVYELKYATTFEDADFYSLQDKDRDTFAGDLVVRERSSFVLATTVLGVTAVFRDLPHSVWRATWPLSAAYRSVWYRVQPKLDLKIDLDANAVVS